MTSSEKNRSLQAHETGKFTRMGLYLKKNRINFILAGFIILCLYPVFSCWYYGDDTVTSDIHLLMRQENRNLVQYLINNLRYYVVTMGRFFPVHILQRFLTFYVLGNISQYRIYIIIMNIIAVLAFAKMVKYYSGSRRIFHAVAILFPGVLMFFTRNDDAVTSYFMFIQTLVIYLSVSLISLRKYIESEKKRYLVISLLLFLLSLMTYETSYLLITVYPLAFFYSSSGTVRERLVRAIRGSVPYFITAVVCFGAYVYLSINSTQDYKGVNFNLDIKTILVTFLKQIYASFPIVPHNYLLFDSGGRFQYDWQHALNSITALDVVTAILFVCLIAGLLGNRGNERIEKSDRRFLVWLSLLLVVCPSLVISVSSKYQEGLTWGMGYLTIYITRLGLLLLGFLIYDSIIFRVRNRLLKASIHTVLILILVVTQLFCQQGNRNVVNYKNQTQYLRHVAENAVDAGLLRNIPEDSTILLGNIWNDYPYFTRDKILSDFCGNTVKTDTMLNFMKTANESEDVPKTFLYQEKNVYYFYFEKFQSNEGYAFSCRIHALTVDGKSITGLFGRNFRFYYSGEECGAIDISVLEGGKFVQKRYNLELYGYKKYILEIPDLVDLKSVELVKKVNTSMWDPK